jgi:membrane-associated phospholipid phosphatase
MTHLEQNPTPPQEPARDDMTPGMRLAWLIVLFLVQSLYFPINRSIQGGVVLATPWDASIPLWPVWVIPYLLSLVWWAGCFVWAAWKMEDGLYRAFVTSLIVVMVASYVVYVLYPTYIVRPSLQGNDWLTNLVRLLYENDRVNNAFPSGHTYTTVLIALFWWRWYPRQRWLWATIAVVVLLSTLFTRQHNIPDLFGGIAFAYLGYRLGLWWARRGSR